MKLTKEECLKVLEETKYLTAITENEFGVIEYNSRFEETTCYELLKTLIKEHFELVEEYKDCRRELDGFYHSMSNPPLKFEELKEGMWVWYDVLKEYVKITYTMEWCNGFKSVSYFLNNQYDVGVVYGENSFYAREVK